MTPNTAPQLDGVELQSDCCQATVRMQIDDTANPEVGTYHFICNACNTPCVGLKKV